MSPIQQALSKLNSSVARLEQSAKGVERSFGGQQRDMFSLAPAAVNANNVLENGVIAKRLDSAIKKVEALLKS